MFEHFRKASLAAAGLSALLTMAAPFAAASPAPGTEATANLSIEADIVPVISIKCNSALTFGEIFTNATGGTVLVDPSGTNKYTATGLVIDTSSVPNRGACVVSGDGDDSFTVTLPSSATLTSGSNTMTVSSFTHAGALYFSGGAATLANNDLYIGGSLAVNANQAIGSYNGVVPVQVDYVL